MRAKLDAQPGDTFQVIREDWFQRGATVTFVGEADSISGLFYGPSAYDGEDTELYEDWGNLEPIEPAIEGESMTFEPVQVEDEEGDFDPLAILIQSDIEVPYICRLIRQYPEVFVNQ